MQYTALLLAAATAVSAAALEPRLIFKAWCGTPIAPSPDCSGSTTYCCSRTEGGYFRFQRTLFITYKVPCSAENKSGLVYCG
ncbi:hypothetical protein E4U42_003256 [Claviceps africana]|uniref:Uncharacterized protein n=1 Tax=Claviceps africana TaxID=83212 RepID=A0A8K0NHZ7_9HYPO|nr:hypothetical protein E4U42_003256 [Claviceps africana]